MGQTWKVRVAGSAQKPFKYRATFVWSEPGPRMPPLLPANLYAEGDLAAYLEDCGASLKEIVALLKSLEVASDVEIVVTPPDELLEVLWAK